MRSQQVFDEAIGVPPPTTVDVDRVVRRQRRAAKVRPVLASVAALVVAATGITAALQLTGDGRGGPLLAGADPLAGFPEYTEGVRVVAAQSATFDEASLTLSFTPSAPEPVLLSRCEPGDWQGELYAELSSGQARVEVPLCPLHTTDVAEFWSHTSVEVGTPVTITVNLTEARPYAGGGELDLPVEGTFALAVGEPVPFEEYPLPPRPAVLAPLESVGEPVDLELVADPVDPNQPVEATLPGHAASLVDCDGAPDAVAFHVSVASQTPGSLRVSVNGAPVVEHTRWDYEPGEVVFRVEDACQHQGADGELTVRVEPEHLSGDWSVRLYQ